MTHKPNQRSNLLRKCLAAACFLLAFLNCLHAQTSTGNGTFYSILKVPALDNAPAYFYIDTNIPATDAAAPQIQVTGYMYATTNRAMKITLGWYFYGGYFYWTQYQNELGYNKPSRIRLGTYSKSGSDYVRIEISNNGVYWSNYTVSATDRSNFAAYYNGWSYNEGEMPAATTSQITVVNAQPNVSVDGKLTVGGEPNVAPGKITSLITDGALQPNNLGLITKSQFWAASDGYMNSLPQIAFGYGSGTYVPAAIGMVTTNTTAYTNGALVFATRNTTDDAQPLERMRITSAGYIGIGTSTPKEMFSVNGNIRTKKLIVTQTGWPDYVFEPGYPLKSLSSIESYIKQNKHLPGIPSAKEVEENGNIIGDTQTLLLKKIEELTLHLIGLNRKNEQLAKRVRLLESKKQANVKK
jgi:hypothetical protein